MIRAAVLCLALSACATTPPAPASDFCLIAEPIRLTAAEWAGLTDESAAAILQHNAAGEAVCGW